MPCTRYYNNISSKDKDKISDKFKVTRSTLTKIKNQISLVEDGYNSINFTTNQLSIIGYIPCELYFLKILKLHVNNDDNIYINITRLFSDFQLSNHYPFTKLVLDTYDNSYYKIYKPSIRDDKQYESEGASILLTLWESLLFI